MLLEVLKLCIDRLLRAAVLGQSVLYGDSDSVNKVKEMFSNWSKLNARFDVSII